jgi:hypothetical protein
MDYLQDSYSPQYQQQRPRKSRLDLWFLLKVLYSFQNQLGSQ